MTHYSYEPTQVTYMWFLRDYRQNSKIDFSGKMPDQLERWNIALPQILVWKKVAQITLVVLEKNFYIGEKCPLPIWATSEGFKGPERGKNPILGEIFKGAPICSDHIGCDRKKLAQVKITPP